VQAILREIQASVADTQVISARLLPQGEVPTEVVPVPEEEDVVDAKKEKATSLA